MVRWRRIWREHQLLVVLSLFLLVVLGLGTWATWYEYVQNEQGGGGHHGFFSWTFLAYWSMQLLMNFAPELMGTIMDKKILDDDTKAALVGALTEFGKQFAASA